MRALWCLVLVGCAPEPGIGVSPAEVDPDPIPQDGDAQSQCGDVTTWDVVIEGSVQDDGGVAVPAAAVALEDRGWSGDALGWATARADGSFTLTATGVTAVDGCWGTVLDYVLVGEQGALYGERGVNSALHLAIDDGSLTADTPALVLDPPG